MRGYVPLLLLLCVVSGCQGGEACGKAETCQPAPSDVFSDVGLADARPSDGQGALDTTAHTGPETSGCATDADCDDGLFCTNDACIDGVCEWTVAAYFCAIDGECVPSSTGAIDAPNVCVKCQPEIDQWDWSAIPIMEGKMVFSGGHYKCHNGELCPVAANCIGKECGDDGCGGDCSGQTNLLAACMAAGTAAYCTDEGLCECEPDCEGKDCGDDGCKGSCGKCESGEACNGGVCGGPCVPNCSQLYGQDYTCGPDGCGGSCGECPEEYQCSSLIAAGTCYPVGCFKLDGAGCAGCGCEACVCELDPFCCEFEWDAVCAGLCWNECDGCLPMGP